jgi:hypothetical protein
MSTPLKDGMEEQRHSDHARDRDDASCQVRCEIHPAAHANEELGECRSQHGEHKNLMRTSSVHDNGVADRSPSLRRSNSSWLHLVVIFDSYDYFPPSVSFFQISDSLRNFTQLVTPVDDRCYFSGRHELVHDGEVLSARSRQNRDQVLAHEP